MLNQIKTGAGKKHELLLDIHLTVNVIEYLYRR